MGRKRIHYPVYGEKFEKWTVLGEGDKRISPTSGKQFVTAIVQCECGKIKTLRYEDLYSGSSTQCRNCRNHHLLKSKIGKHRNSEGYILVMRIDHPYAKKSGYVLEHRLIMESIMGRYLLPTETVHHKNGVKSDNRPENLELRNGSHGQGARPEDLIKYAIEILELYAPEKLIKDNK